MKTYFFIFSLLFVNVATAQLTDKQLKELHDNTAKTETTMTKLNESINESMKRIDSLNMVQFNKQNERNLDAFLANRKEQERKEMKRMYWRLGFGILMFAVLIVSWVRRKKMAAKNKTV